MALVDDLKEAAHIINELGVAALNRNELDGHNLLALARRLRAAARGDEASGAYSLPGRAPTIDGGP